MVAQTLSVVANDEDLLGPRSKTRLEGRQQAADFRIHESQLSRIGLLRILRAVRLGRLVGSMRIKIMHPQKVRCLLLLQVIEYCIGRRGSRTFLGTDNEGIVILVEPAREAELPSQWKAGKECSRAVAEPLQPVRQELQVPAHPASVLANPVIERIKAGKHRRMGRQGRRRC